MDFTEINRCIEILNKRPKLFFQKENISEKLQCFDTIQQVGTPTIIYSLISFLSSDNILIQTKAAETILILFSKLKSVNDFADTLKHVHIERTDIDFYRVDFDERTYVQLLGIASLNSNGYVREIAVKELARIKNADGLKFILLRLGDWVGSVRKAATEAAISFLKDEYLNDLLKELPMIDWLLKVKRVDLSEIHNIIIQFILNHNFSEEFYKKIKRLDDKSRFRFYKSFLTNKRPTREQIYKIAADRNFIIRLELVKHLADFDQTIQKELLEIFLQDPSTAMRLSALYATKNFSPDLDGQIATLLSDETASVREMSRHLLREKGIDFAQLYRQRIIDKQFLPGSILGLSETGDQADLPSFKQHIHGKINKLIVASLVAINKFNPDTAKNYSLELLIHRNKKVRNKAAEILAKNFDSQTLCKVRDIYDIEGYEIKKTILSLFNRVGGWNIIGDLLLALTDENEKIQILGWQFLDKWKQKSTRLFTTPPKAEIDRANQIFSNIDLSKLKMTPSRTILIRDFKFYLR
jgi:HEAT repeat protein